MTANGLETFTMRHYHIVVVGLRTWRNLPCKLKDKHHGQLLIQAVPTETCLIFINGLEFKNNAKYCLVNIKHMQIP